MLVFAPLPPCQAGVSQWSSPRPRVTVLSASRHVCVRVGSCPVMRRPRRPRCQWPMATFPPLGPSVSAVDHLWLGSPGRHAWSCVGQRSPAGTKRGNTAAPWSQTPVLPPTNGRSGRTSHSLGVRPAAPPEAVLVPGQPGAAGRGPVGRVGVSLWSRPTEVRVRGEAPVPLHYPEGLTCRAAVVGAWRRD